jgi:hypothetical protein
MTPSIPIPTDNIYKFSCLFGLVLIVAGIFSYVSIYATSLDRKIKFAEVVISLEAKADRTKSENDLLGLHKKLIEVTKSNQDVATAWVGTVLGLGIVMSFAGARAWYTKIQLRDDKLAELQLERAELEVERLRRELPVSADQAPETPKHAEGNQPTAAVNAA